MKNGVNIKLHIDVSWMLKKKIVDQTTLMQQWGGWDGMVRSSKFSISTAYKKLAGPFPKVFWKGIISHNMATPKSIFNIWLLAQRRLHIMDRILKLGMKINSCVGCVRRLLSSMNISFFSVAGLNRSEVKQCRVSPLISNKNVLKMS